MAARFVSNRAPHFHKSGTVIRSRSRSVGIPGPRKSARSVAPAGIGTHHHRPRQPVRDSNERHRLLAAADTYTSRRDGQVAGSLLEGVAKQPVPAAAAAISAPLLPACEHSASITSRPVLMRELLHRGVVRLH